MKKSAVLLFLTAGLLSVFVSGCQTREGMSKNTPDPEQISALPFQFAGKYGIFKSDAPVYELDTVIESNLPQKEMKVSLTSAILHKKELIVSIVLDDYSEADTIPAGGEPPAEGEYVRLQDGTLIDSERYQNQLWKSGDGIFLAGPGIPADGIKPQESMYASYPDYYEAYGHMRYFIEAKFEIPPASDSDNYLSGYALRILDFEKPLEFAMKQAPEYGTLEELAEKEQGDMDTHDGISIISIGEKTKEGILVSWYVYSEAGDRQISIIYMPPYQTVDLPTVTGNGKEYAIRQLTANPYWDNTGLYGLSDVKRFGRRTRCMFDVPQNEQNGAFRVNIPGITFLSQEESTPITLSIPEDYEELSEDITWKEGSVRILGITRMKEPQSAEIPDGKAGSKVRKGPAVYIDVEAVHEDKNLSLRRLFCQRKLKWSGWEHARYDFDENGSLSGFRVFYDEGDTEITLKFDSAAFYWDQTYGMETGV